MGILNFLKGTYDGKVGATVGSKWKNKGTIRTYAVPANPRTPGQQTVRAGFAEVSAFVALFADQIKRLTALDVRGMSVRNAILKLNASQISAGALDPSDLIVSRGGLPNVSGFTATVPAGLASINCSWNAAEAATLSNKAVVVVVAVDYENKRAYVGSALNTAETLSIPGPVAANAELDVYWYVLDFRGSSKVASINDYAAVTAPSS